MSEQDSTTNRGLNASWLIYIFICAFVTITLLSKSSFLYPFNDWVDSNCFMTLGKSILSGKVPYRDLFEQKGPLIYFLHTAAALISYRTFAGVYIFEVISCAFFLLYSVKICLQFTQSELVKFVVPAICAMTYSTLAFRHGDSVEEFFLPLITYALYTGIRICTEDLTEWNKDKLVFKTGICAGIILWTKYTSLGFFIGWVVFLTIYFLLKREFLVVGRSAVQFLGGMTAVTVPVLLYFAINRALKDLFYVYFYINIIVYGSKVPKHKEDAGWLANVRNGTQESYEQNLLVGVILLLFVVLFAGYANIKAQIFIRLTLLCGLMFIFKSVSIGKYYALVFCAYLGPAMASIILWLERIRALCVRLLRGPKSSDRSEESSAVTLEPAKDMSTPQPLRKSFSAGIIAALTCFGVVCMVFAVNRSSNKYLLLKPRSEMPQYKFAEIINREENPTLFNYGFLDGGFYTVTGLVPELKYFCKWNVALDEITEAQSNYIKNGEADFIVTRDKKIDDEKYELVAEAEYFFEIKVWKYRLYKLK